MENGRLHLHEEDVAVKSATHHCIQANASAPVLNSSDTSESGMAPHTDEEEETELPTNAKSNA
jgi:hypothetical protein